MTLSAACSSGGSAPAAFHPRAASSTTSAPVSAPGTRDPARQSLDWPPFGSDVRIAMTSWRPSQHQQRPAVRADKNFLLAFLYAEYRGNTDDRWKRYAAGQVVGALEANLNEPSVTTESFTGTISLTHMSAYPVSSLPGSVAVSECFNDAGAKNTNLNTGKPLKNQGTPDSHYYLNTDVLKKVHHRRWRVVEVYPVVPYSRAKECKP